MGITVGVANPGNISGVGVAQPGKISNVSVAKPGKISGVTVANPGRITSVGVLQPSPSSMPTASKAFLDSIYKTTTTTPAPVYAPRLNVAAINANARKAAEKAVNPYYTKQLNEFLAFQAAKQKQQQGLYDMSIKNYEDTLAETLAGNAITGERTTQDVAQNIADTNLQADQFQTDSGQAFDQARLDAARQASTGGIGAQQVANAVTDRNIQEGRQVQKFDQAIDQQTLFKQRSFADLARSGELATKAKEKGAKAAKFDLDSYIKNAKFETKKEKNQLEKERLQSISSEQGNQSRLLFNKYLAGISNPAQYEAAMRTYGSAF